MTEENITEIEKKLNYTFKNKDLLIQAFTRKSFAKENPNFVDNEVLEFYGDKILSFILAKKFLEHFGLIQNSLEERRQYISIENEGQLTQRHSDLSKNSQLIGKMEVSGLLKFVNKAEHDELSGKAEGDLFEAILAAVAIDSGWDISALSAVVDKILHPEKNFGVKALDHNNFNTRLKDLCQKENFNPPELKVIKINEGYIAKLFISGENKRKLFKQKAKTQKGAELAVTRRAYIFMKLFWLFQPVEDWIINPISQLQELKNHALISDFEYKGESIIPANSNKKTLWTCTCKIYMDDLEIQATSAENSSFKTAKYDATRQLIPVCLSKIKRKSLKGQGLLKVATEMYK